MSNLLSTSSSTGVSGEEVGHGDQRKIGPGPLLKGSFLPLLSRSAATALVQQHELRGSQPAGCSVSR